MYTPAGDYWMNIPMSIVFDMNVTGYFIGHYLQSVI